MRSCTYAKDNRTTYSNGFKEIDHMPVYTKVNKECGYNEFDEESTKTC